MAVTADCASAIGVTWAVLGIFAVLIGMYALGDPAGGWRGVVEVIAFLCLIGAPITVAYVAGWGC